MLSFERIMPIPPMTSEQLRKIARHVIRVETNDAKLRVDHAAAWPQKPQK